MGPIEKDIEACVNTETLEKETFNHEICLRIFDDAILLMCTGIFVYTSFQLKESLDFWATIVSKCSNVQSSTEIFNLLR